MRRAVSASFLLAVTEVTSWKALVASEDEASDDSREESVSEWGAVSMGLLAGSEDACADRGVEVGVGVGAAERLGTMARLELEAGLVLLSEEAPLEVLLPFGIAARAG
jgi:hypothetical protein